MTIKEKRQYGHFYYITSIIFSLFLLFNSSNALAGEFDTQLEHSVYSDGADVSWPAQHYTGTLPVITGGVQEIWLYLSANASTTARIGFNDQTGGCSNPLSNTIYGVYAPAWYKFTMETCTQDLTVHRFGLMEYSTLKWYGAEFSQVNGSAYNLVPSEVPLTTVADFAFRVNLSPSAPIATLEYPTDGETYYNTFLCSV